MTISIEDLKKKIVYRSTYRGTKEMDIILTYFTKKYINELNEKELLCMSKLLDLDDENLYKYKMGEEIPIKIEDNKVSKLFRDFIYKKD
jgi:antitoxin CptB